MSINVFIARFFRCWNAENINEHRMIPLGTSIQKFTTHEYVIWATLFGFGRANTIFQCRIDLFSLHFFQQRTAHLSSCYIHVNECRVFMTRFNIFIRQILFYAISKHQPIKAEWGESVIIIIIVVTECLLHYCLCLVERSIYFNWLWTFLWVLSILQKIFEWVNLLHILITK